MFVCDVAHRPLPRRCSPAPGSRCRRGSRRPSDFDIAPDGRELALTADLGRRAADDEPARHRHRRSRDAAQARADRGDRHRRRARRVYSPDGRALVVPLLRHEARVQRPGPPDAARAPRRGAMRRARAAARPRDDARRVDARQRARSCSRSRTAAASGSARLAARRARRRAVAGRAGGTIGGFAQSRDGGVLAFDRATRDASAGALRVPRRRHRRAADRDAESRAARAARAGRRARGDGQGLGRRAGADVDHLSAELRSEEEVAAAALDPRRAARGAPRRLALPLEHAGVRRARLRRRRASTTTARPASARSGWRRSPAATARRSSPTSRPATDCHAAAGLHRPRRGSSRPAAATAASWSPT